MERMQKQTKPKALAWSWPSHVAVFVRNLQLLKLDQQPDWPGITVRSLSPSSQNQRQRTKAVEWALYHLCALWDPAVTQDSVNLRAALFRVLTDLKKNGDLGKETILRKSMLDDCKGEKFEELLAAFSTNVLRRVLGGSMAKDQLNPTLRLSLAGGVSAEDYSQLALPLLLAHRVSIAQSEERRTRVQGTFDGFSELLDSKKVQLEQRARGRPQSGPEEPADLDRVTEQVKTNWLGSG
ncbi:hypothetical protein LTS12_027968, partial [Elasticomyces elasticus]